MILFVADALCSVVVSLTVHIGLHIDVYFKHGLSYQVT